MAKVDLFRSHHHGIFLFYNLDAAVGLGSPNRRDDVLLVQYLLKACSHAPGLISILADPDGDWDKEWDGLLDYYEDQWKRKDISTWRDRRLDPVPNTRITGSGPIHHTQYKILTLNATYNLLRPKDFPNLASAHDCPQGIRGQLRAQWVK